MSEIEGWMYYGNSGYKYTAGAATAYGMKISKAGTKITTIIDMDALIVGFKIQGFPLGPAYQLNLNDDQKKQLLPAVDMCVVNDAVSIVN